MNDMWFEGENPIDMSPEFERIKQLSPPITIDELKARLPERWTLYEPESNNHTHEFYLYIPGSFPQMIFHGGQNTLTIAAAWAAVQVVENTK